MHDIKTWGVSLLQIELSSTSQNIKFILSFLVLVLRQRLRGQVYIALKW